MKKNLLITIFLLAIFLLAVVVWYSPILFKGYPTQTINQDILLAINYHKTRVLATENNQNVVISSNLIKEEGHPLVLSQYLRSLFFAKIFDILGIPTHNNLILISIILYALVLILFTVLTLYLFNFKTAAAFSLIYIFSPLGWGLSAYLGSYEFCLIFWALFLIFYFLGDKKTKESPNKFNNLFFVLAGIFLALSALSKEVTFVFALAIFIFLLIKKLKWQLIYIFIPFVIVLIIFWLPSVVSGQNRYISLFSSQPNEESIFSSYLHVFPDPYTYYFGREEFLEEFRNQNLGFSENLETRKILTNFGFEGFNLFSRFKISFYLLFQHFARFFSLEDFGGPFFALLLILGLIYLRNKYRFLYQLLLYWLGISFFVFIFVILASRNHLMDFIWPIILGIVLGLFYLLDIIKDHFGMKDRKAWVLDIIIIGLILYGLILVNHVVLGRKYDKDFVPRSIAYAQEIKKFEIRDRDVIAVPGDFSNQTTTLNYLTDKSFVIFQVPTLNKLLKEGKIKQAFEAFNVKYILGYPDDLSSRLIKDARVINIASNSLKFDIGEISSDKSFFMNIVR